MLTIEAAASRDEVILRRIFPPKKDPKTVTEIMLIESMHRQMKIFKETIRYIPEDFSDDAYNGENI